MLTITPAVIDRFVAALNTQIRILDNGKPVLSKPKVTSNERRECVLKFAKDPDFKALATQQAAHPWEWSHRELQDSVVNERCGTDYPQGLQSEWRGHASNVALGTSGFTRDQYAMLQERSAPFCEAYNKGQSKLLRIAYRGNGGGGPNAYYVYSQEEADALKPHCAEIMKALPQIV